LIQGGAIHGLRKARDILLFNYSIVKGEHYEIRGFYTYENILVNMVLENDIIDDLKSDTKISTISTIAPSVLRHYFKLIDFSHVISKGKGSRILIGF
jgi:replication factor A1